MLWVHGMPGSQRKSVVRELGPMIAKNCVNFNVPFSDLKRFSLKPAANHRFQPIDISRDKPKCGRCHGCHRKAGVGGRKKGREAEQKSEMGDGNNYGGRV